MIAVFSTLRAHAGRRDELLRSLEGALPEVESLDGTRVLALHVDANEPDLMAEMPKLTFATPVRQGL